MTIASKLLTTAALIFGSMWGVISVADAKPIQSGGASWYGPGFNGKRTASGERFNARALTAAHKSLPFGLTRSGHQHAHRPLRGGAHHRPWALHARRGH